MNYYIDGYHLTIKDIVDILDGKYEFVKLSKEAEEKCRKTRNQIDKWLEKDAPVVYGVNTGLGNLKDVVMSPEDHVNWNKTIPYPHAVGFGEFLDPTITRAELLIRANVLARSYSAVRVELIERMLSIFNKNISPAVYEIGSTGLSDLASLAQIVMVVAGLEEAKVIYNGEVRTATEVFKEVGLEETFTLQCKEVLAQMNGSTMTQAMSVIAFKQINSIIDRLCMDISAKKNSYKWQKKYLAITNSMEYIKEVLNLENNITCDNPLLFEIKDGTYEPVMGCNCSNTQVGFVLDQLNILICETVGEYVDIVKDPVYRNYVTSIHNSLKNLCMSASADNISTKANQEDHVEFSYGAARKVLKALKELNKII